jgi:hypothetical protein
VTTAPDQVIVFVGDALRDAVEQPGILLRPPASRGDLSALVRNAQSVPGSPSLRVGIIDGTTRGPSLPPKEVMLAIRAGVEVYGAVADGALRAAECTTHGMTGVGELYEQAVTPLVSRLDEYWVPTGVGPDDQSLAAWRISLAEALVHHRVAEGDAQAFLAAAQRVPWWRRTLAHVVKQAEQGNDTEGARRAVTLLREGRHVMRDDARRLVATMLEHDRTGQS